MANVFVYHSQSVTSQSYQGHHSQLTREQHRIVGKVWRLRLSYSVCSLNHDCRCDVQMARQHLQTVVERFPAIRRTLLHDHNHLPCHSQRRTAQVRPHAL